MCCRFWKSQIALLPWAVRPLVEACLQGWSSRNPKATALLDCDFFTQPVRTAAYFLMALHPTRPPVNVDWPSSLDPGPVALLDLAPWLAGEY